MNKVVLITGGSRGIGAAIAKKFATLGYDIAFTYARNADKAREVAAGLESEGVQVLPIQADGSTTEGNQKAVAETVKRFNRLDVLVCNAGMSMHKTIAESSIEDISNVLNLNLRAAMVETHEALRHMTRGGRIILMGSAFAGRVPFAGFSLYAASKAGLRGFAQGVARDIGPSGITINVVEPGPIDTDMNDPNSDAGEVLAGFVATKAYGNVNDIARTVTFLAAPESGYITGAAIPVDGGLLA